MSKGVKFGVIAWRMALAGAVAGLVLAGGCGSKQCCGECEDDKAGAAKVTSEATPVNTMCPIGGDEFKAQGHPAELVRVHKGTAVGFCCPGCTEKFDKMDDAGKDSIVALAKANKTKG